MRTQVSVKVVELGSQHIDDSKVVAGNKIPRDFAFENMKKMTL